MEHGTLDYFQETTSMRRIMMLFHVCAPFVLTRTQHFTANVSRASLKVMESLKRFAISIEKNFRIADIGAAPGGISLFLRSVSIHKTVINDFSDLVCEGKVIAVDPAELKVQHPNLVHLKQKVELSIQQLQQFSPFDLMVIHCCDEFH